MEDRDFDPVIAEPAPAESAAPSGVGLISRLGVLRHRHYRALWLGASVSSIGSWMEAVGVQWLVAEQTGSTVMMGVLAVAQMGPMLLLGVIGGLVADRYDRRLLLLSTQIVLMAVAATLTVFAWRGQATPGVLIALMVLHGTAMAFSIPAWQTLTPNLVPREELGQAIALNSMQFNVARVVGPALAGVLLATHGAALVFLVNTLTFLAAMAGVLAIPPVPPQRDEEEHEGAIRRIRNAFGWVFANTGPRRVFLGLLILSVLAGPLLRMLPLFVSEVFHEKEPAYGLLLSLMGIGAVAGVVGMKFIPKWYPLHHQIPLSIALCGGLIVAFSAAPTLWAAGVVVAMIGVTWVWSFSSSVTAMQLLVRDSMRGRVMSVVNTAVFGAMPFGSLLVSAVGEPTARAIGRGTDFATRFGTGALAAVLVVAGVVMLIWRTPEIDGIEEGEPGYDRRPGLMRGLTARAHRPELNGSSRTARPR